MLFTYFKGSDDTKKTCGFEEGFLQQVTGLRISQMAQYLLETTNKINNVVICGCA